jgi:methylthioribose-1-phosphate isomerase
MAKIPGEMTMRPVEWLGDRLKILDQTQLPGREIYIELADYRDIITAIKQLKVRGAPAIGIAAAYGIVVGAIGIREKDEKKYLLRLDTIMSEFAASRPTAVNLFYAIDSLKKAVSLTRGVSNILRALLIQAMLIHHIEETAMADLSRLGAGLLQDGQTVLTHCNTGQLATGVSYGTALGVIKAAVEQGKHINVYADETRPLLQGARLTVWELHRLNIPVTLITDSMAGYFLHQGKIDCVITGADRIAANGDTANKIGTYSVSVLAKANRVPFYIAAPTSTIDIKVRTGKQIPIEERDAQEVTQIQGVRTAPAGAVAANPSFDVTPHNNIAAIITEKGIIRADYKSNIRTILQEEN